MHRRTSHTPPLLYSTQFSPLTHAPPLPQQPISQRIGTPGSAGQFFPGIKAKIVKPDGSLARCGEAGELWVGGPQLTLGYVGNEEG